MAAKDFIVAIELGSSKVTGIAGQKNLDGSINVLAVVKENSSSFIRKGVVYNIDKTAQCLTSIIKKLENQLKTQITQVYVGVGGQSIRSVKNVVTKNKQTGEKASVIFNLDNNDEKISIKVASTSWFKADDFKLFYYGNGTSHGTSIQDIEAADIAENDIYTPNGIKIQKLKKGLNIVRTNKGVKKIVK